MAKKKEKQITIDKIVVLAKLSDGKVYQIALNKGELNTLKGLIELMHQSTVKIVPIEIETIDF